MKINKQLCMICIDIYTELYKSAQPSADFKELIKLGDTKKNNWFMKYYLDITKLEAIIDKHAKEHKLSYREKQVVSQEVLLGCSPISNKKKWRELNDS